LRTRAEIENARSKEALGFLREMLSSARPATARDRDTGMLRLALDKAARRLTEGQNDQEVRSEIRQILGTTYFEIGAYDQAEKILREEVEWLRRTRGPDDPRLGDYCVGLGRSLDKLNRMSEAEPFLREAVAIHGKSSGSNTVTTAWVMMRLAEFLEDRGRRAEADEAFREALAISHRQKAGTNRVTMTVQSSLLNDLSIVMEHRGNRTQAVALAKEALLVARLLAGKTGRSPTVAAYLNWLGNLAVRSGDYDQAEPLLTESVAI
jgi:tetratricopeptide (TPR) repeat protein